MSRLPQSHFGSHEQPPARPRGNALGVAGFVLVMIGLVGCCIPPVLAVGTLGGILCFFGLFRAPRALAIAGFILALIQTALLTALLIALGGTIFAVMELPGYLRSAQSMMEIGQKVEEYRMQNGTLPDSLDQLTGITRNDGWGNPIIYQLDAANNTYSIITNGPDGLPNTDDELELPGDFFRGAAAQGGGFPTAPGTGSGTTDGSSSGSSGEGDDSGTGDDGGGDGG